MMADFILALTAGLILDLLIGDPEWFPHPVRLMGAFISHMEKRLRLRGGNLRYSAVILTASTVLLSMGITALILWLLSLWGRLPLLIGMSLINWTGLAAKCLAKEARDVGRAFDTGLPAARGQVARIVGRDTQSLTEPEIIRATVETVAENTADGIISPMLYSLLGGPVLMMGFKAASTLDSMVGYLDPKYKDIGWSSARLDDVLNYIPARLTALLMCVSAWLLGYDGKNALRIVRRDHQNHQSPNCAWPESAAAGALHIQLGGTHLYFGKPVYKPTIGDDGKAPDKQDILKMNRIMCMTSLLLGAAAALIGLVLRF